MVHVVSGLVSVRFRWYFFAQVLAGLLFTRVFFIIDRLLVLPKSSAQNK